MFSLIGVPCVLAAADDVTVKVDDAKVIAVVGVPSVAVVGNPNIADVTIQDKFVFVHGRNYGSTNLIVLDADGNELAALDIMVMTNGNHNVQVFRAGEKYSYNCGEICESVLRVGDSAGYFEVIQDSQKKKNDLAKSSAE
jgi:hypothetical protein